MEPTPTAVAEVDYGRGAQVERFQDPRRHVLAPEYDLGALVDEERLKVGKHPGSAGKNGVAHERHFLELTAIKYRAQYIQRVFPQCTADDDIVVGSGRQVGDPGGIEREG